MDQLQIIPSLLKQEKSLVLLNLRPEKQDES